MPIWDVGWPKRWYACGGATGLIDWLVALPAEQEQGVRQTLLEEEMMAYMTSFERSGLLNGQRAMLRRVVQTRFGAVPEEMERRIEAADQAQLEQLAERASTTTSLQAVLSDDE